MTPRAIIPGRLPWCGRTPMNAYCPRDKHARALDPQKAGRLRCQMTNCPCDECHRSLSLQEEREWTGTK
jgi:hypothetical protein